MTASHTLSEQAAFDEWCPEPYRKKIWTAQAQEAARAAFAAAWYVQLKSLEPSSFDWRRLLKAYMLTVLREEGVTHVPLSGILLAGDLTAHERAAILAISNEVMKENPDAYVA